MMPFIKNMEELREKLLEANPIAEKVEAMGDERNGKQYTLFLAKLGKDRIWFLVPKSIATQLPIEIEVKEIIDYLDTEKY